MLETIWIMCCGSREAWENWPRAGKGTHCSADYGGGLQNGAEWKEGQSMDEKRLLNVDWKYDPTAENPMFELQCTDPEYQELHVSVSASEVKERVARAMLIDLAFKKAREMGLDETCLRFHV